MSLVLALVPSQLEVGYRLSSSACHLGLLWWRFWLPAAPFIMGGALNLQVVLGVGIGIWLIVATLLDVWHKSRRSPITYL